MYKVPKNIPPFQVPRMMQPPAGGRVDAPGTATPQQKILAVADQLGVTGMEVMQATTRTLWDTLPLDGRTTFDFFRGVNNRAWPLTNLSQNKLEVGEAFIVEWIVLAAVGFAAGPPALYSMSGSYDNMPNESFWMADLSLQVANEQILKPIVLTALHPAVNKDSGAADNMPWSMFTLLGIPSLQEFIVQLRTQDATVVADSYIHCALVGTGLIYRAPSAL